MTVTPEQIEGASFSTVKRGGYRTEEVDRFLRTIGEEYRMLNARVRAAEGSNEDLAAASQEMATLMRDVHAQLGEKRRVAEAEVHQMMQTGEREAAAVLAEAASQADDLRAKSDRVLSDAEHHAELLRSDGEQRVREQAQETLRAARGELQELLRQKHEVLRALGSVRSDLGDMEATLEAAAISPDAIDDGIINQTLIDLREAQTAPPPPQPTAVIEAKDALETAENVAAVEQSPAAPAFAAPVEAEHEDTAPMPSAPPPPPPAAPPETAHPASASTFFLPPETDN